MKNYTITVNGNVYDVVVEEGNDGVAKEVAPVKAPVKKAAPVEKKAAPAGAQGSEKVNAPMPGKILTIKASEGQSIKQGDVILVLEAMKMENEIVSPQDGIIASINVSVGDMVEAGAVLATLN